MKKRRIEKNKEFALIKEPQKTREYSIEELIELGKKHNRIELAKPLFKK